MQQFQIIYDENKVLDMMFDNLYDSDNDDIIKKNKLELLVELGELANETKCFKYWSYKTPKMELVKEEYADCLIMTLCFFNLLNISLDETFLKPTDDYVMVDLIGYLYKLCSLFYEKTDNNLIKEIFAYFIALGHQLELNDNEIIDACLEKINKNKNRFSSGF